MITIEEMQVILDELAEEFPQEFYKELNGGILLLPDIKVSPEARNHDLYILGQYQYSHSMGRYIIIYFGSFSALYGYGSREKLKKELRKTLRHEFTHHLEHLVGEKDLEVEDQKELDRYKGKF